MTAGPLHGLRVLELVGVGPVQFAGLLLADLGAEVVRIDRPGGNIVPVPEEFDFLSRNRIPIVIDLKDTDGLAQLLELVARADVLIEGSRPGVAERLGYGPDTCLDLNPRLVYGRLTGWGQDGPLSQAGGHDLNYASLIGALDTLGSVSGEPAIPGGAFAVFPGGSLYLVVGVLAALRHTAATGEGQIVDAAVIDGLAHLHSLDVARDQAWQATQDSSSLHAVGPNTPFYATYRTADGRYMSVAAVEPKFYARLIEVLGLRDVPDRADQRNWDAIRTQIGTRFAQRTQRAWTDEFAELDACVTPVLKLHEAAQHPHVVARGTFVKVAGRPQPAPAPRFSATPTAPLSEVRAFEQDFGAVLAMWSTETRKSTRA